MQVTGALLPLLLALLAAPLCQADLLQHVEQIPPCGLTCILESVPATPCASVANSTCVCASAELKSAVRACMSTRCTVEEQLVVKRVQEDACGRPRRSRLAAFWGFIAVEVFTTLTIAFRLYARWRCVERYEADDYIMVAVALTFIPFTVIGQYTRITAFGVDIWTLDPATITTGLLLFYVDEGVYLVVLALCKLAVLFFFLRIFPNRWFRAAVYAVMAFIVVSTAVFVGLQILQCRPVDFVWQGWKGRFGGHHCIDVGALVYVTAGFAIVEDAAILALPLPLIAGLRIGWRQKASVALMLGLGVFALATGCIRLQYLVGFAASTNPTWDYADAVLWTQLEANVSALVASLPAIRQYYVHQVAAARRQRSAGSKYLHHQQQDSSLGSRCVSRCASRLGQWQFGTRTTAVASPPPPDSTQRSTCRSPSFKLSQFLSSVTPTRSTAPQPPASPGSDNQSFNDAESQIELGCRAPSRGRDDDNDDDQLDEFPLPPKNEYPLHARASSGDSGSIQVVTMTSVVTEEPRGESKNG